MYDDASEWEVPDTVTLRSDLIIYLTSCIDIAEKLAQHEPSRELSVAKTKLDEAEMWLTRERG